MRGAVSTCLKKDVYTKAEVQAVLAYEQRRSWKPLMAYHCKLYDHYHIGDKRRKNRR